MSEIVIYFVVYGVEILHQILATKHRPVELGVFPEDFYPTWDNWILISSLDGASVNRSKKIMLTENNCALGIFDTELFNFKL